MKTTSSRRRSHQVVRHQLGTENSHPLGTSLGAVTGGVTVSAVGTIAGPAVAITGLAMGVWVGGLAGRCVAEKINPTVLEAFSRAKRGEIQPAKRIDDFRRATESSLASAAA